MFKNLVNNPKFGQSKVSIIVGGPRKYKTYSIAKYIEDNSNQKDFKIFRPELRKEEFSLLSPNSRYDELFYCIKNSREVGFNPVVVIDDLTRLIVEYCERSSFDLDISNYLYLLLDKIYEDTNDGIRYIISIQRIPNSLYCKLRETKAFRNLDIELFVDRSNIATIRQIEPDFTCEGCGEYNHYTRP